MLQQAPFPIRVECPPGACVCERDRVLADPGADWRALRLTREEEKRLLQRIEAVDSVEALFKLAGKLQENLGVTLTIAPGDNEVRTVRGFQIVVEEKPGLCRKVRQSIPSAVRRCLESHPHIAYAILDAHDLLGGGTSSQSV